MPDSVFVDTNVLVYLLDESEPAKRAVAAARLAEEGATRRLVVSTQVIQELYVALTRGPHPVCDPAMAEQAASQASRLTVVQVDVPLVMEAIRSCRAWKVSFWDALVLGAAAAAGCARILTEDLNDGQEYGTVRVENPFR